MAAATTTRVWLPRFLPFTTTTTTNAWREAKGDGTLRYVCCFFLFNLRSVEVVAIDQTGRVTLHWWTGWNFQQTSLPPTWRHVDEKVEASHTHTPNPVATPAAAPPRRRLWFTMVGSAHNHPERIVGCCRPLNNSHYKEYTSHSIYKQQQPGNFDPDI